MSNYIFGLKDYVKIDLKSLCVIEYNNYYKRKTSLKI